MGQNRSDSLTGQSKALPDNKKVQEALHCLWTRSAFLRTEMPGAHELNGDHMFLCNISELFCYNCIIFYIFIHFIGLPDLILLVQTCSCMAFPVEVSLDWIMIKLIV